MIFRADRSWVGYKRKKLRGICRVQHLADDPRMKDIKIIVVSSSYKEVSDWFRKRK